LVDPHGPSARGCCLNALLIIVVLLALVILATNTMVAIAFLRGRRGRMDSAQHRDQKALDELHERVEELRSRRR
jgi:hypothetical protein